MMKLLTLVLLFGVGAAITSLRAGGSSAKKVLAVGGVGREVTLKSGKPGGLGIKFEKASSGHGPMKVTGINPNGQANEKVFVGDTVVAINDISVLELTYADATKIVTAVTAGNNVKLTMGERPAKAVEVAKPSTGQSTKTSAPKAGKDECKVQLTAAKEARTQFDKVGADHDKANPKPADKKNLRDWEAGRRSTMGLYEGTADDAKKVWLECCNKKEGRFGSGHAERWAQTSCPASKTLPK